MGEQRRRRCRCRAQRGRVALFAVRVLDAAAEVVGDDDDVRRVLPQQD
eukprot:gene14088-57648_t